MSTTTTDSASVLAENQQHVVNGSTMEATKEKTTATTGKNPDEFVATSPTSTLLLAAPGVDSHPNVDDFTIGRPSSSSCPSGGDWSVPIPASQKSQRTRNPIRAIVDPIFANIRNGTQRGDGKDPISLALGDPTASKNLPICPVAIDAIVETVTTNNGQAAAAGYVNACGTDAARQAIAKAHGTTPEHVIVASGCSGALELALTALLDPEDDVLLVPSPGFPLYQVIAESHGAQVLPYRLLPDRQWEVDLDNLEELMAKMQQQQQQHLSQSSLDHKTTTKKKKTIKGIVINNPSNPTGAVYSREHLQDIVDFCHRHKLPIVADEIYGDMVLEGSHFVPLAKVAAAATARNSTVPVITASGIGKQYLLPGWRVGWIVFHDNIYGSLQEVEAGAKRLAQVILGASHLAQSVVPALLDSGNSDIIIWKSTLRSKLQEQATFLWQSLSKCRGLTVSAPGGAMYAMVHLDMENFVWEVHGDLEFTKLLLEEENVIVLPGRCFFGSESNQPTCFRVVFCASIPELQEATQRIAQFCKRHCRSVA